MPTIAPFFDVYPDGTLRLDGIVLKCALGPTGMSENKAEGDNATPTGTFPLRRVMYREDRVIAPITGLPTKSIQPSDGWCDDVGHADYNKAVTLPMSASYEELWREDHVYDVIVEVGYNDDPPVAGFGSAIFMHLVRPNYEPTQGCIALHDEDLRWVLERCDQSTEIRIHLTNP